MAEIDGRVVGCGAVHVLWADLGEVRTLAVHPEHRNARIGAAVLEALIATARDLGLTRLFALTFHTGFFGRHGFTEVDGAPVDPDTSTRTPMTRCAGPTTRASQNFWAWSTSSRTRWETPGCYSSCNAGAPRASRVTPVSDVSVRATEVIAVTTADRIDPVYRAWAPSVVVPAARKHVGTHRRPGGRSLSWHRMFYTARHVARGR